MANTSPDGGGGGSTDDGSTDDGGGGGDGSTYLPGWLFGLKPLVGVVGVLTAFASNPREFIVEHVLTFIVDIALGGAAYIGGQIEEIWLILADSFVATFDPVFAAGASIVGAFSTFLLAIQTALLETVSVAGPAAPLIVLTFWVLIGIATTAVARWALKATPYIGQWI